jgi:hypothetical protein
MRYKKIDNDAVRQHYEEDKWTIVQIAEKFNVNRATISSRLKEMGVKTRRVDIGAILRGKPREQHPKWKGGRLRDKNGYVMIPSNGHPFPSCGNGRYILEHRYVMEQHIGGYLLPEETVHHKNGIRDDNRIENLELRSSKHGMGQDIEDKVNHAIEILK